MVSMKVGICQMEDKGSVEENVKSAVNYVKKSQNVDVLCFPEFFAYPLGYLRKLTEKYGKRAVEKAYAGWILEEVVKSSKKLRGYLIAGSVIEKSDNKYYNTCYVLRNGEIIAKYRKINVIDEEIKAGITPGKETVTFNVEGVKAGIMICADCLKEEIVKEVCSNSKIVFLPISMTSPDHPKVEGHPLSIAMAKSYGVTVVKISRISVYDGKKFGVKSAVIDPSGIVAEADRVEETFMVVDISF